MNIKDIEDTDCYYYGKIVKYNKEEIIYILQGIIWDGEEDFENELIGKEITPQWWKIELYED
jgi:hypothetical protein